MNAKQRRQVRRAMQRFEHFDWYIATGGPDDGSVRAQVARHIRPLVDRCSGQSVRRRFRAPGQPGGRRAEEAFGKRCACGRPAHGTDSNGAMVCVRCGDWLPF
ncbi:MAG TPA: hypothetical protein PK948_08175 [Gemmatimonadales bacterium]|nr:hypothetical protein [Gemmatimonadales bacterium]